MGRIFEEFNNLIESVFSLEDQWDESFPEKWLLIPCRYDTLNSGVVCESCPIGYEVKWL